MNEKELKQLTRNFKELNIISNSLNKTLLSVEKILSDNGVKVYETKIRNVYDFIDQNFIKSSEKMELSDLAVAASGMGFDKLIEPEQKNFTFLGQLFSDKGFKKVRSKNITYYYCMPTSVSPTDARRLIYEYLQAHVEHTTEWNNSKILVKQLEKTPIGKYIPKPRQLGQYLSQWAINGKRVEKQRINGEYGYFIKIV